MRAPWLLRRLLVLAVFFALGGLVVLRVADLSGAPEAPSAAALHGISPKPAHPRANRAAAPAIPPVGPRAPCFGAESVDPAQRCQNRRLRTVVVPTPDAAAGAQRREPCRRKQDLGLLRICFWGSPIAAATRTIALIGDSHASHWRAAMQAVVRAKRWRAISISRAGCPLTLAHPDLPGRSRTLACIRWNRAVLAWVARRRHISVVFTGAHRGSVVAERGRSVAASRRRGYAEAWRRLLRSGVRQIVVFRDTPRTTGATLRCVQRAARSGADAGAVCALPRRFALPPDPLTLAAAAQRNPRIQIADLSSDFCGPQTCPPVIGGALVLRDVSHMTTTFSSTLGPALLATVDRLSAAWR